MLGDDLGVVQRTAAVASHPAKRIVHRLGIDADPRHAAFAVPHAELEPDVGFGLDRAPPLQLGGGTITGVRVRPWGDAHG